jgi:hypothetical protein
MTARTGSRRQERRRGNEWSREAISEAAKQKRIAIVKIIAPAAIVLGLLAAPVAFAQSAPQSSPATPPTSATPSLRGTPGQSSAAPVDDNGGTTGRSVSTGAKNRPVTAPNNDAGASTAEGKGQ